jgi:hypothetical protein
LRDGIAFFDHGEHKKSTPKSMNSNGFLAKLVHDVAIGIERP